MCLDSMVHDYASIRYDRREGMMKRKRNAAKTFRLAVLGVMLFLAGCTTGVPVKVMPYVGVTLYPPTDPTSVMVLQTDPLRPHQTLGHVIVEPEDTLSVEETERILRDTAAAMGANAVVIIANMGMKEGVNRWQTWGGQVISAVAIRYKD